MKLTILTTGVLVLASGAPAQEPIHRWKTTRGNDPPLVDSEGRPWTPEFLLQLDLPRLREPRRLLVPLALDDRTLLLELRPQSQRAPGCELWVDLGGGVVEERPLPPPRTYRGEVVGTPGSFVTASLRADGRLSARIRMGLDVWSVQPWSDLSPDPDPRLHAVYSGHNRPAGKPWSCPVPSPMMPGSTVSGPGTYGPAATCHDVARIGIDADYEFFQWNNGSVSETIADIDDVMNDVNGDNYEPQLQISHGIQIYVVRSNPNDPYTSSNHEVLLDQFAAEWNANFQHVERDVAHLMTGRDIDGGTIGYARLATLCAPSVAYGFAESNWQTTYFGDRVLVTAHELGHNWGANHVNCGFGHNPCKLMCPSREWWLCFGSIDWSDDTKNAINSYRASTGCTGPQPGIVYVDGSKACSNPTGSLGKPYPTVAQGLAALQPGQTLSIGAGNYPEAPLTLDASPPGNIVVATQGTVTID